MNIDLDLWKKRKNELNLTFDELAEKSSVSRRQLLYLFKGEGKNTGVETVQRIERALGIEEKNSPSDMTESETAWMELYYALTDENKDLLVKMISAFNDMPAERRRFVLDAIRLATSQK